MRLEADVVENAGLVEVPGLQPHIALDAEFLGVQVIQSTAHHGSNQGILGELADILRNNVLAVTHDGNTVAEFKELFQLMRNKQDGHALGLQAANRLHQLSDFFFTQRRSRLVHNDKLRIQRYGLSDLHHLLKTGAQLAALHLYIDLRMTQGSQSFRSLLMHSGIVQKQTLFHGTSHENIVRNRKLLDDVQFLVHAGNTRLTGLNRISEDDLFAVNEDVSLFRIVNAGQHLDQGGLASAIFANQTVDLTGSDSNGHVFQCNDTRKTFGNIFQFDDIFAHGITSFLS